MQQLLLVEIIKYSGKDRFHVRFPYEIVEAGGPIPRNFNSNFEKGDLIGPYEPGAYLIVKVGKVSQGPKLGAGTRARLLQEGSDTNPWLRLGLYLVGKTLPSATLSPETILQAVRKLQSWAEYGGNGKWKEELRDAEIAARILGFDGLEIVEYDSYDAWNARPEPERSFP